MEALGELFGSTWALLATSWSQLGASWAPLGANLGTLEHLLGPTWVPWPPLGPKLEPLGGLWDSTWPLQLTSKCKLDSTWRFKLDYTWAFEIASKRHSDSIWSLQQTSERHLDSLWPFQLAFWSNNISLSTSVLQLSSCSGSHCQRGSCWISFELPKGLPSSTLLHLYYPKGCQVQQ